MSEAFLLFRNIDNVLSWHIMIVGIDEVGRGSWAGPLVVGAVLLGGCDIVGLTDSKKLTAKQREKISIEVRKHALGIGLGWISPRLVDEHGLSWALRAASRLAIEHIAAPYTEIIIDGTVKFLDDPRVTTLKKADLLVPSVSAASIVAKVARDRYMQKMDVAFSGYGFASHVGYGTAQHGRALSKLGPSPIHRCSFAPVRDEIKTIKRIDKTSGRQAEYEAAKFLTVRGYEIVQQNWRTRWCEIDIVATKGDIVYFVEVKYRKTSQAGDGLAAITQRKLAQMKLAAEMWRHSNNAQNMPCQLAVIALEGSPQRVVRWEPLVGA